MAIDQSAEYGAQVDTSTDPTGYPYGQARNITVAGDGTGTPLEKKWLNDLWGFWAEILDKVGVTPSGTPEKVGASQYADALDTLYVGHGCEVRFTESSPADGAEFTINGLEGQKTGYTYTVTSDTVEVPEAGQYMITSMIAILSDSTSNPAILSVDVEKGGFQMQQVIGYRLSAGATDWGFINNVQVANITTPSTERIGWTRNSAADTYTIKTSSRCAICRIG